MGRTLLDTSRLPQDVLSYTDIQFYDFIKTFCGKDAFDLLSIQSIRSVDSFLSVQDIYSIFELDSDDVKDIQTQCGFKKRNGVYTVRPGIKSTLDHVAALLEEMKRKVGKTKRIQSSSNQSTAPLPSASSGTGTAYDTDTAVTSFISNKNETEHRTHIEKSIEEWCIKNEKTMNIPNFNLISGEDYHLQFTSSLDNVGIKCSCGILCTLFLGDSGNFKVKLFFIIFYISLNVSFDLLGSGFLLIGS
jgi:hypothetical protein